MNAWKWWQWGLWWMFFASVMTFLVWIIWATFGVLTRDHIADPNKKVLTTKDVLLALEAHEAKCKPCPCGEGNDELAKQFAKTLKAEGIPRLPGVKR